MKVIDAIIQLQQLDPNLDLRIDLTTDNMDMFKFGGEVHFYQIETDETGPFVAVTNCDYDAQTDSHESYPAPPVN